MIEVLTAETPNGYKISIALEELELPYTIRHIKLSEREQKEDWYLRLNPNGRIPTIIDHDNGDFVVFESGAILIYLAEKTKKLLPGDVNGRSLVMQWLMFQMGNLGPMMGQANVFYRYAPEKISYAIQRYQRESRRLLEVLDGRLKDNEYLAGEYSIADIANFCWARRAAWGGIETKDLVNLHRWIEQLGQRPAVKKGLQVPPREDLGNQDEKRIQAVRQILS